MGNYLGPEASSSLQVVRPQGAGAQSYGIRSQQQRSLARPLPPNRKLLQGVESSSDLTSCLR